MPRSRNRPKPRPRHSRTPRRDSARTIGIWDMHLPVVAVEERADGSVHSPRAIVYGTAFPIGPGLFLTAGHVIRDVRVDGEPALSVVAPGAEMRPFKVGLTEVYDACDLALLSCEYLRALPPIRLDFDRPLDLLAPVSAVGFPLAMDAEYVSVTPRAFAGSVVARRQLKQFSAQPVGYEVSFFAPQGLSGAPLLSIAHGAPRCYGWIVQQARLGLGEDVTPVGIAIGIEVLLTVAFAGRPLASVFGRAPIEARTPTPPPLPGGLPMRMDTSLDGWPDDDVPPTGDHGGKP